MPNPVTETLADWKDDSAGADSNLPAGASSMLPGSSTELAGELRNIKSNTRGMSLDLQWEIWAGPAGYGTANPIYVSPTSFTLPGDQRLSGGGPVQGARAIRATLGSGYVYAYIINDVFSSGVTTVTLGTAVLDGTLSQVDFGSMTLGLGGLPGFPFVEITRSTTQSIPNGTLTPLVFDAILNTNAGSDMWVVGSPDQVLIPTTGLYLVSGQVTFATNGTGVRAVGYDINGDTTNRYGVMKVNPVSGDTTDLSTSATIFCTVGDIVQMGVLQTSGGALNVSAGTTTTPQFSVSYLGAKKQP